MKAGLERAWKLWTSDLQQTCIPKVVLGMDFRGCLLIISVLVKCRNFYISGVRSVRPCPFACKILSVHSSVNLFFPCK